MGARRQHTPKYRKLIRHMRDWREAAKLTQRGLAKELGRVHSYVYKVEAGERRVDPVEFAEWCDACNVDPAKGLRTALRA